MKHPLGLQRILALKMSDFGSVGFVDWFYYKGRCFQRLLYLSILPTSKSYTLHETIGKA